MAYERGIYDRGHYFAYGRGDSLVRGMGRRMGPRMGLGQDWEVTISPVGEGFMQKGSVVGERPRSVNMWWNNS